jgi:ubiquinone/menaquinone biosynthesis C-methylase UbiE
MAAIQFDQEMGRLQRALAVCHDLMVRRGTVLEALDLRTGEKVLEVGCGGGSYAAEAARFVGPTGQVAAIDVSADQIAAARERCAEFPWVQCGVADAVDLPHGAGEFDAVYSVQALEYVADPGKALAEIRRVLRPGGRFLNLSTNWSSCVWHSEQPDRMRRILDAWSTHETHRDLPSFLAGLLRDAGFQPLWQRPVPMLNTSYNEASFSYWIAGFMARFAVGRGTVSQAEVDAWLAEFGSLESRGAYFFSSTPVMSVAIRVS